MVFALLLGKNGVGKTSLYARYYGDDIFHGLAHNKSISYFYRMQDSLGEVEFLDPHFQSLDRKKYDVIMNTAAGYFLVYDVNDRSSFNDLYIWRDRIDEILNRNGSGKEVVHDPTIFVVANKCDVTDQNREVSTDEGMQLARRIDADRYYEVSATSNLNVDQIFTEMGLFMKFSKMDERD